MVSYLTLRKPKRRWLFGLLFWVISGAAYGQAGTVVFPQMAPVTRFKTVGNSRHFRGNFSPLAITRREVQANGKSYTEFIEKMGKKPGEGAPLPFQLRLAGDSLLMFLTLYDYVPAARRAQLLDSLGPGRLEGTFFRFGAPVGTKWTCLTSYSWAKKWNSVTTELREIKRMATGELLYVLAFREDYYGVSDYEFWRELVISRERGLVQMTGHGMIGGELVYERDDKPVKLTGR